MPLDNRTIVEPLTLAGRLGLGTNPTAEQLDAVTAKILDAQADVVSYLERDSLFPYEVTMDDAVPRAGYPVDHWRAWPQALDAYDDDIAVKSAVQNPDGTYQVTFLVGLDGPSCAPIVRYVTAHAQELTINDANSGIGDRQVTSISAEGQSISFAAGSVAAGAAGALPSIDTLRRYRRPVVHQSSHGTGRPLWPNR